MPPSAACPAVIRSVSREEDESDFEENMSSAWSIVVRARAIAWSMSVPVRVIPAETDRLCL